MAHWTDKTYIESPAVIGESMHRGVDRAEDEVATLVALLDDGGVEPERALGVACGIGRHSIDLAEAGVAVDGVDVSPEYIETARERAADACALWRTRRCFPGSRIEPARRGRRAPGDWFPNVQPRALQALAHLMSNPLLIS